MTTPSPNPLSSTHAGERAQFLAAMVKFGAPMWIILLGAEFAFLNPGTLLGWLGLLLLNALLNLAVGWIIYQAGDLAGRGMAHYVYAGAGIKPTAQYSAQESLVARGFYREAVESYRALIKANPADLDARILLAAVYRKHLNEPQQAEQLYKEVRAMKPNVMQEFFTANMMIELYRETGQRDRLIVELARFADRWKGTRPGQDAAKALKELKKGSGE